MKKWLVGGTLGGLALLLLVLPFFVGLALERGYPLLLESLREQVGERFAVEGELDRGLLGSSSETVLRPVADPASPGPIRLHHRWAHGPFAAVQWFEGGVPLSPVLAIVHTAVNPEGWLAPGLVEGLDGRSVLEIATAINIDGTVEMDAQSPAFESADGAFASQGLQAEIRAQGGVRGARGRAEFGGLRVDGPRGRLSVETTAVRFHGTDTDAGSRVDGDFDLGPLRLVGEGGIRAGLSASHGTFKLARAPNELDTTSLVVEFGEAEFAAAADSLRGTLRGGHLQFGAHSAGPRLASMEAVFGLDSIDRGGESFGPGLIRVVVRELDLAAAGEFRRALETLASSGDPDAGRREAEAELLGEWLPTLLRTSPEFVLERFELTGWGGELEGEGKLQVDGRDPSVFVRESTALQAVKARLRLVVPTPLVNALLDHFLYETLASDAPELPADEILAMVGFLREMTLGRLLETDVLRPKCTDYRVDLRFEEGVLIVNGRLLGPGGLMGILTGG